MHEISVKLAECESRDELCRQTVELGRRLGFSRLGIWVVDDDNPEYVRGTCGTDEKGELRDEHDIRWSMADWGGLWEAVVQAKENCLVDHAVALYDAPGNVVGQGTQLIAPMWDGRQVAGALRADDLLEPGSLSEPMSELLTLFATMVGH